MMTKKHFNAIAKIINAQRCHMTLDAHDKMITEFIVFLKTTNPAFDAGYFRVACKEIK